MSAVKNVGIWIAIQSSFWKTHGRWCQSAHWRGLLKLAFKPSVLGYSPGLVTIFVPIWWRSPTDWENLQVWMISKWRWNADAEINQWIFCRWNDEIARKLRNLYLYVIGLRWNTRMSFLTWFWRVRLVILLCVGQRYVVQCSLFVCF